MANSTPDPAGRGEGRSAGDTQLAHKVLPGRAQVLPQVLPGRAQVLPGSRMCCPSLVNPSVKELRAVSLAVMRPRTRIPQAVLWLAEEQEGVLTRRQVMDAGVSRDGVKGLVASGDLRPISPGVYSIRDVGWDQLVRAGLLIAGPGSTIGGQASAHLIGIASRPALIDVWAPGASSYRNRKGPHPWVFHRGARSQIGNPPHETVEETVLDLCARESPDGISSWVGQALGAHRTMPDRLLGALAASGNTRNRRLIAEYIEATGPGTHSPLEARYLRDVERAHGLPSGRRQLSVSGGTRSDVAYEEYHTIVELDGVAWHWGINQNRDSLRDAEHLSMGWVTMRFGWVDVVSRPCRIAALVADVLASRGWQAGRRRCPECPPRT